MKMNRKIIKIKKNKNKLSHHGKLKKIIKPNIKCPCCPGVFVPTQFVCNVCLGSGKVYEYIVRRYYKGGEWLRYYEKIPEDVKIFWKKNMI